jgi:hypothetical protein
MELATTTLTLQVTWFTERAWSLRLKVRKQSIGTANTHSVSRLEQSFAVLYLQNLIINGGFNAMNALVIVDVLLEYIIFYRSSGNQLTGLLDCPSTTSSSAFCSGYFSAFDYSFKFSSFTVAFSFCLFIFSKRTKTVSMWQSFPHMRHFCFVVTNVLFENQVHMILFVFLK